MGLAAHKYRDDDLSCCTGCSKTTVVVGFASTRLPVGATTMDAREYALHKTDGAWAREMVITAAPTTPAATQQPNNSNNRRNNTNDSKYTTSHLHTTIHSHTL